MLDTVPLDQTVSSDARHELVARILASEQFSRAPRLQRFLTYIVDCYFHNRLGEITEQQIGVHVFDKSADYNPGDDNVVRSYARTLRKRLEDYFAKEGAEEPWIVEVPRGGYVPVFTERSARTPAFQVSTVTDLKQEDFGSASSPMAEIVSPPHHPMKGGQEVRQFGIWLPLLLAASLISGVLGFKLGRRGIRPDAPPAIHSFWSQFANGQNTLLVPSDAGLTMVLGLTKRGVNLPQYVTGTYVSSDAGRQLLPEGWANANVHRYSDLIDVEAVSALSRLLELPEDKTSIRYARDLRASDLKEGNAVLIGGANANPWVQLFDQKLNFALEFVPEQRTFLVRNRQPNKGEASLYPYGPENWSQISYGLVALRPSLDGKGHVLLIEGVAAAGLQGAVEFLFDEGAMVQLIPRISDSQGRIKPFEMLLRTNNVGANETKTEIVGLRND